MRRREKTTDEARRQKTLRRDFERCFAPSGQPIENNIFPGAALRGDRRSALPRADLLQPFGAKKPDAIPSKPAAPPTSSADPWTPRWTAKDRFEPPAPHTAAIPTSRGPRPALRGRKKIQNFARLPKALREFTHDLRLDSQRRGAQLRRPEPPLGMTRIICPTDRAPGHSPGPARHGIWGIFPTNPPGDDGERRTLRWSASKCNPSGGRITASDTDFHPRQMGIFV